MTALVGHNELILYLILTACCIMKMCCGIPESVRISLRQMAMSFSNTQSFWKACFGLSQRCASF